MFVKVRPMTPRNVERLQDGKIQQRKQTRKKEKIAFVNKHSGKNTGASSDLSKFIACDQIFDPSPHVIELADGSKGSVVTARGVAKVQLYDVNGSLHDVILQNALHAPSYKQNILSVNSAVEGGSTALDKNVRQFGSSDGTTFNIEQTGRLHYLNSISS